MVVGGWLSGVLLLFHATRQYTRGWRSEGEKEDAPILALPVSVNKRRVLFERGGVVVNEKNVLQVDAFENSQVFHVKVLFFNKGAVVTEKSMLY